MVFYFHYMYLKGERDEFEFNLSFNNLCELMEFQMNEDVLINDWLIKKNDILSILELSKLNNSENKNNNNELEVSLFKFE